MWFFCANKTGRLYPFGYFDFATQFAYVGHGKLFSRAWTTCCQCRNWPNNKCNESLCDWWNDLGCLGNHKQLPFSTCHLVNRWTRPPDGWHRKWKFYCQKYALKFQEIHLPKMNAIFGEFLRYNKTLRHNGQWILFWIPYQDAWKKGELASKLIKMLFAFLRAFHFAKWYVISARNSLPLNNLLNNSHSVSSAVWSLNGSLSFVLDPT